MAKVKCANCEWAGTADQCEPYRDFWSRVEVGEIIPHGDCPECGAFCYADTPAQPDTAAALAVAISGIASLVSQLEQSKAGDLGAYSPDEAAAIIRTADAVATQGRALLNRLGRMVSADAAAIVHGQPFVTPRGAAMTAKTPWTPGPWFIEGTESGHIALDAAGPIRLGLLSKHGLPYSQRKANSELIALAPEMADALRDAWAHITLLGSGQTPPDSNAEICDRLGNLLARLPVSP